MSTAPEAIYKSDVEDAHFRIRLTVGRNTTLPDVATDPVNPRWRERHAAMATDPEKIDNSRSLHITKPVSQAREARPHSEKRNFVEGSVNALANADGLVSCCVLVGGKYIDITLPESAFDGPVFYGAPFKLSMVEADGYSTPRALLTEAGALSSEDEELYRLATL